MTALASLAFAGFALIAGSLALPVAEDTCKAVGYSTGDLICDGKCSGDPAPTCRVITHSLGINFCGCADGDDLPKCCELAEYDGDVSTVGDCPSCGAAGNCEKKERAAPFYWEAYCTGSDAESSR